MLNLQADSTVIPFNESEDQDTFSPRPSFVLQWSVANHKRMLIKSGQTGYAKRIRKRKSNVANKPVSASSYKEVEGEVAHDVENWGLGLGSSDQKCL